MASNLDWREKRKKKRGESSKLSALIAEKKRKEAEAKAKAEREYASKQASVDTEISKPATGTNTGGRSAPRSVATGGSPKDDLRIKRKNYTSMYSGAGRNIV